MPKEKKPKIKVERIGSSKKESRVVISPAGEDRELTKFEKLQREALELGMPQNDIEKFASEDTLEAAVNAMKAIAKKPIVDSPDPKEEKEVEKHWTSKADRQKAYFDGLPKVRIIIPCEPSEKPGVVEERIVKGRMQTVAVSGAVWSKTFNGYKVVVPKGVYVEVSEAIADNISEEFNQVQRSNQKFGIDRIDPKTGRPVREQL